MGHRLHVATSYKVTWGGEIGFNYKVEEFHNLLSSLEVSYTGDQFDSNFECDAEQIKNAADTLQSIIDDRYEGLSWQKEDILNGISALDTDIDSMVGVFRQLLKKADTDDGYVHFSFF